MEESLVASGYVEVERQEANSGILMNVYTHLFDFGGLGWRMGEENLLIKTRNALRKQSLSI